MYAVSNAYKTAMAQPVHRFKISGMVGETAFTDANILKGSLTITNQFSSGNDFKVGSVVIGSLSCTFLQGITVEEDAIITISEGLRLANQTYEYVPMGVFKVAEANRSASGTSVKAYDNMALFDKAFPLDNTYGKPYDLAQLACADCDVTLGMTEAQMDALPNGTEMLNLYPENDIETWRDFIFWVAQSMACFATMDRQGRLVFRKFLDTSVDEIDSSHRFKGASFSNFITRYTGISIVNIADKTTSYYGQEQDDGLTYNLGSNPFLQYGSAEEKEIMRRRVLNGLANVNYTPFKAQVAVGALYDLGDVLTHSEGLGNGSSVCVMRYVWKYGKSYETEGVGKNPALTSAKSKADKAIQGLAKSTQSDLMQYYLFTNATNVNIGDEDEKKIIDIRFASNKQTIVVFHAEILLDAEVAEESENDFLVGKVRYVYNDSEIDDYYPTETWIDGKHILHLLYYFKISDASVNRLKVYLNSTGGSVSIETRGIQASIYGQALVATDKWDGNIEIEDEIEIWQVESLTGANIFDFEEVVGVDLQTPLAGNPEDELSIMQVDEPQTINILGIDTEDVSIVLTEVPTE